MVWVAFAIGPRNALSTNEYYNTLPDLKVISTFRSRSIWVNVYCLNPRGKMPANGSSLNFGKLLSFLIFTFGAGLLQLWILLLLLYLKGNPPSAAELLGDGGLYFFSTSLAFSSFVALTNHASIKFGDLHFNVTAIMLFPIIIIAIVAYVSVLSDKIGIAAAPFSNHLLSQFSCLILASIYGFYVATVTGVFKRSQNA